MATAIGDLVVRLGAQTSGFERGMARSRAQLAATTGAAGTLSQKMGGMRSVLGSVAGGALRLAGAFAPLSGVALFAGALRSGEQFNQKMRNSLAIMGEVNAETRAEMRKTAFAVARDTQFGASQAAEAYYFLASAGMTAKQSIAAMPQVAAFAQAGQFDLARATDLATDAQSALGMKSKDAQENLAQLTRVTDVLVKANTLANASVEQFSESLTNKAGAALRVVGKDIEEGTAVLAALADQGVKGAEAGTALNIVMRDMQTKALQNKSAFASAGIAVFDEADEMRNLADVIGDLEGALDGMSDAQKKATLLQLGFSDKSISYIQTMLGTSDAIRTYEKQLRQAAGTTKEVADKQMTPFQKGWAKLSAAFVDAGATLMDILGPAMGAAAAGLAWVMDGLKKLLGWLRDLYKRFEGPIKSFGKMLAIGTALIALVPAIGMLGGALATAFTVATGPVGLFIAAATAIGYLFVELVGEGETFGQKMESVFGKVRGWVDDAAFGFRNFGALAQLAVIEIVALALEWFPQMERPIERVVAFFVGAFAGLKAFFSSIVQNIIGGFQEIANVGKAVVAGLQAAWDSIKVGDLSGAVEAFTGAFQKELASQKDVIAPNAFAEFGKAYEEAARGVRQRFAADGGLRGTLDSERERLTRAIAEREAARAAVDAAQPPGGATMGSGAGEDGDGKKGDGRQPATRVEYVAAQGHRTADAYSTILAATAGRQKPMQEVAKETKRAADESEKQTGYLRTMSGMSITEVSLD